MNKVTFLLFFIAVFAELGSPLTCFRCKAPPEYKYACKTNINNVTSLSQQCSPPETTCMVLVVNGTTIRGCGQANICSVYQNATRCSTCSDSFCNNGFVTSYYGSLGIFAALFLVSKCVA